MSARAVAYVSCFAVTVMGVASEAHAQEPAPVGVRAFPAPHYQLFRTDIGFGGATVPAQEAYGGNVSVEPKFNVLDNLAVGARVEAMIGGGGSLGSESENVSVQQNVAVATLLKTDYFLTRAAVRPWVGLGVGRYAIVSQGTNAGGADTTVNQNAGSYFGIAPQLGLELGGFRISATLNHILGANVEVTQTVGGETKKKKYSHDYATVEIGFRTGGRRR